MEGEYCSQADERTVQLTDNCWGLSLNLEVSVFKHLYLVPDGLRHEDGMNKALRWH